MLYVIATPIGNLGDLSERAMALLAEVDLIAAEDTRHTGKMLTALGIGQKSGAAASSDEQGARLPSLNNHNEYDHNEKAKVLSPDRQKSSAATTSDRQGTRLTSLHTHNEKAKVPSLVKQMLAGKQIALVTDAGTPGVSDPGYALVDACLDAGIRVVPVPGPSALLAALSVAGIAGSGFIFEGFLPAKRAARQARLQQLNGVMQKESHVVIFYEAPHRILACLEDMRDLLGGNRTASICRELTKLHEQVVRADLATLVNQVAQADSASPNKQIDSDIPALGEFVIVVQGGRLTDANDIDSDATRLLMELLKELPPSKAAGITARLTSTDRRQLYDLALSLESRKGDKADS